MTFKYLNTIAFPGCMSLGDAIVINGIIHQFIKISKSVHVSAQSRYYETLKCLYQDWPEVSVVGFDKWENEAAYIKENHLDLCSVSIAPAAATNITYHGCPEVQIGINWDRQYYEGMNIPFSKRYSEFRLPKNVEGADELYNRLTGGDHDYCLFHGNTGQHPTGFNIPLKEWRLANGLPDIKIIEIEESITSNMIQYIKLIKNASEIHCVPSSFFCLVDSIATGISPKLFYHDIRITTLMQVNSFWNGHRWHIVKYNKKF